MHVSGMGMSARFPSKCVTEAVETVPDNASASRAAVRQTVLRRACCLGVMPARAALSCINSDMEEEMNKDTMVSALCFMVLSFQLHKMNRVQRYMLLFNSKFQAIQYREDGKYG
jgi:hypothetical protein